MQNKVELIGHYGSDLTHAQSAWTSTNRELSEDKLERVPQLLTKLASEGHHTPFEKSTLHFLVTSDIASHIHLIKHRIGVSVNAESARYKELKEDKCYIPIDFYDVPNTDWFEIDDTAVNNWADALTQFNYTSNWLYHKAVRELTPILGRKRAKESARYFKTYSSQITCDVSFNFRSFYHFLSLRNKPDAQKEIREIAQQMLDLVRRLPDNPFEHTLKAFKLDE